MTGRMVLVTRPHEEAESLAAALAGRGFEPLVEPLLEIRFRQLPPLRFDGVQALLCTSANGVRALARASPQRALPLFAVGEATAERARAAGFATVESAAGTVADLAELAARRLDPSRGRMLHIAGGSVAGDLAGALLARGFSAERLVLYDAEPAAALSPAAHTALRARLIGYVLFFSPRTAAVFARLARLDGVADGCTAAVAVSISSAADAAIAALPWRARRIAARPEQAALLAALDEARQGTA